MTNILIRVKSCNACSRVLLVSIRSFLKSVLRLKCLILGTYHTDTLYLREQGCENSWLFFEAKNGSRAKSLRNTTTGYSYFHISILRQNLQG